jgi:tetratricopeptide (TPR) repeat protein
MIVHLDRFWSNWGHLGECADFLRRGLDAAGPDVPPAVRGAALRMAGLVTLFHDIRETHGYLAQALELARSADDRPVMARAMWGLAVSQFPSGDEGNAQQEALVMAADAVAIARGTGDAALLGECLGTYADLLYRDPESQSAAYAELIPLTTRSGDRVILAISLNNLGLTAVADERWEAARSYLEQAGAIYDELGRSGKVAVTALGWVHLGQGDPGRAEATFREALRKAEHDYSREETTVALLGLACTAAARGSWPRAARLFGIADRENDDYQQRWGPAEETFRENWITATERTIGHGFKDMYALARDYPRANGIAFALRTREDDLIDTDRRGVH